MELRWQGVQGHTENKARLQRFLREQRLPHALLLHGRRGIGKSRIAEVLAAAVLCKEPQEGEACGICEACAALKNGVHPDFYRVVPEAKGKAVPVIKIEAVRQLQTELSRLPKLSRARAVIIDGAERMNEAAANALLKTLEEPVGVVYFFLLTAARQAILPTIISRCMPLNLLPLSQDETVAVLLKSGHSSEEIGPVLAQAEGSPGIALELIAEGTEKMDLALQLLQDLPRKDELLLWQRAKQLGALERQQAGNVLGVVRLVLRDLLAVADGGLPLLGTQMKCVEPLQSCFSRQALIEALQLTAEFEHRLLTSNVTVRLTMEGYLLRLSDLA